MQTSLIFDLNGVLVAKDSMRYAQALVDPSVRAHDLIESGYRALLACCEQRQARNLALYVLSNSGERTWQMLVRHHGQLLSLFDGIITSNMVGFKKPDARIFHTLLQKYDIDPAHGYFIDDDLAHIQTAQELGLVGIHVIPDMDLLGELRLRAII